MRKEVEAAWKQFPLRSALNFATEGQREMCEETICSRCEMGNWTVSEVEVRCKCLKTMQTIFSTAEASRPILACDAMMQYMISQGSE